MLTHDYSYEACLKGSVTKAWTVEDCFRGRDFDFTKPWLDATHRPKIDRKPSEYLKTNFWLNCSGNFVNSALPASATPTTAPGAYQTCGLVLAAEAGSSPWACSPSLAPAFLSSACWLCCFSTPMPRGGPDRSSCQC